MILNVFVWLLAVAFCVSSLALAVLLVCHVWQEISFIRRKARQWY